MFCSILVLLLCLMQCLAQTDETIDLFDDGQLVTVIAIFRHGDRTIINPYPNDPYKDKKYWPIGFGQLTNKGKREQYELGQWFRTKYKHFLPVKYSVQDIYVRATDVDRTLMSAEANLAGLYPPIEDEIWQSNLTWQPIPVHAKSELEDPILAMKMPCPKYNMLKQQLAKDPKIIDIKRKNHDLFSYLARNAGKKVTNLQELEYLYNTLTVEKNNNFTLPEWAEKVYPAKLKPLADFSFSLQCYTKEMARLKTGPFFSELIDHIYNSTSSLKDNSNRKLWMYSGHDTTIANILKTLDIFEEHSPPYTATILFEIRSVETNFYVNILYKNSTDPLKMTLPGCVYNCPLDKFLTILKPISLSVEKWKKECHLSYISFLPFDMFGDIVLLVVIFMTIFALLCILIAILFTKRRNEKMTYLRLPDDENV